MIGWDHPATAERYERFYRRHSRYRKANEVLIRHAALEPGLRLLDVGAGTGRTADAALRALGPEGSVVCVEPARAMRAAGRRRLRDPRVTWRAEIPAGRNGFEPIPGAANRPPEAESFDRILCGAAIWQMDPLGPWIHRVAGLLRAGGALCFDIPTLYLGEPDEPGGGRDPFLLEIPVRLAASKDPSHPGSAGSPRGHASAHGFNVEPAPAGSWNYGPPDIERMLRSAGLEPVAWVFRFRLTQAAYARWLTIPVLTDRLLPGLDADERDQRIEGALAAADERSFKWERWRGWTAWKH